MPLCAVEATLGRMAPAWLHCSSHSSRQVSLMRWSALPHSTCTHTCKGASLLMSASHSRARWERQPGQGHQRSAPGRAILHMAVLNHPPRAWQLPGMPCAHCSRVLSQHTVVRSAASGAHKPARRTLVNSQTRMLECATCFICYAISTTIPPPVEPLTFLTCPEGRTYCTIILSYCERRLAAQPPTLRVHTQLCAAG